MPVPLDDDTTIAYLFAMTGRLLLALLAFMTSLTGQIAPANARASGVDAVGASVAIVRAERLTGTIRHHVGTRAALPSVSRDCSVIMLSPRRNCEPPVMLGVDRAHE